MGNIVYSYASLINRIKKVKAKVRIVKCEAEVTQPYFSFAEGFVESGTTYSICYVIEDKLHMKDLTAMCTELHIEDYELMDLVPHATQNAATGGIHASYSDLEEAKKEISMLYRYIIKTGRDVFID